MTQGFAKAEFADPGWQDWSPSYTDLTVGNGTVVARYQQIGTTIHVRYELILGSTSSIDNNDPKISLPVTSATSGYNANLTALGTGTLKESGGSIYPAVVLWASTTTWFLREVQADAENALLNSINATSPFTWGDTDKFIAIFTYEAAESALIGMGLNNDHGALSGLSDDDHAQYAKLAGDTFTGRLKIQGDFFSIGVKTDYELSSGAITVTGSNVRIESQTAGNDDCDTINGGTEGDIIFVRTIRSSEDITMKHATGNLRLAGNADIILGDSGDRLVMEYDGTSWRQMSVSL